MNHTPKQQNPYVTAIVVTLVVAGIGVYLVPTVVPVRAVIFQVLSLVCIVAAVFVLTRYKATSFTYTVRPRSFMTDDAEGESALAGGPLAVEHIAPRHLDFVVSKKQGSRAANMECVLGLDCLIAAWELSKSGSLKTCGEAMAKVREQVGKVDLYDYTVTMGPEKSLLLLFRDGENHVALRMEPDAAMERYLVGVAARNQKNGEEGLL